MTGLELYLILILDSIGIAFLILSIMCGSGAIFFFILCDNEDIDIDIIDKYMTRSKKCGILFIVILLINCLMPSTKQAAAIWLVPKIVNNEQIQNVASNSLDLIDKKTQELLLDISNDLKNTTNGE